MNNFCKIDEDPKFLHAQIDSLKEHCATFKRRSDVLKDLLTEEVEEHRNTRRALNDAQRERNMWQNKFYNLRDLIKDIPPGKRISKDILDKLNQF